MQHADPVVQRRTTVTQHGADRGSTGGSTLERQPVDTPAMPDDVAAAECLLEGAGRDDLEQLGTGGRATVLGQEKGDDAHVVSVTGFALRAARFSTAVSRGSWRARVHGIREISSVHR